MRKKLTLYGKRGMEALLRQSLRCATSRRRAKGRSGVYYPLTGPSISSLTAAMRKAQRSGERRGSRSVRGEAGSERGGLAGGPGRKMCDNIAASAPVFSASDRRGEMFRRGVIGHDIHQSVQERQRHPG